MNPHWRYFSKRGVWYFFTLIIAISLNFFLPRCIKGNPVSMIVSTMGRGMTDSNMLKKVYDSFIRDFGLDKPLIVQYFIYLKNLVQGNLGRSFGLYPRTVGGILRSAITWTIALQLPAILVGWILGNVLGVFVAYKKGFLDKLIFPVALLTSAVPYFVLAIVFLFFFALKLGWFPIGSGYSYEMIPHLSLEFISSVLSHYALPFLSIVVVMVGGQALGMRSMSIYELNADYVLYSKLMGIRESKIIFYVFRNAMLPQITGLALSLGRMMGGALITEIIFNYPGIGSWLFTAIRTLDYPLISGCTLVITVMVLLANFTIEIIYGLVDPRIKTTQMEEEK